MRRIDLTDAEVTYLIDRLTQRHKTCTEIVERNPFTMPPDDQRGVHSVYWWESRTRKRRLMRRYDSERAAVARMIAKLSPGQEERHDVAS